MISLIQLFENITSNIDDTVYNLLKWFEKNVEYGFMLDSKKITEKDKNFQDKIFKYYKLSSPSKFKKEKIGLCFDQSLYTYTILTKSNIKCDLYFFQQYYRGYAHVFVVFNNSNKLYRFETSLIDFSIRGPYDTIKLLIEDVYKDIESFNPVGKGYSFNKVSVSKLNKELTYAQTLLICGFSLEKHDYKPYNKYFK